MAKKINSSDIVDKIKKNPEKFIFGSDNPISTVVSNIVLGSILIFEEEEQYTLIGVNRNIKETPSNFLENNAKVVNIFRLSVSKQYFDERLTPKKIVSLAELYLSDTKEADANAEVYSALGKYSEPLDLMKIALAVTEKETSLIIDMLRVLATPKDKCNDTYKYSGCFLGSYAKPNSNDEVLYIKSLGITLRILDLIPINEAEVTELFNSTLSGGVTNYINKAFEFNEKASKEHRVFN